MDPSIEPDEALEDEISDERLHAALQALKKQKLNLKKFFVGMMKSQDHAICTRVGLFFQNQGVEACLESMFSRTSFGGGVRRTAKRVSEMAAVLGPCLIPWVQQIIQAELTAYMEEPLVRKGASGVKTTDAKEFKLEPYYALVKKHTPYLHQLLCGACKITMKPENNVMTSREAKCERQKMTVLVNLVSIMVFSQSQKINGFQVMIGYFLQAQRVSKRALSVCRRLGICVSYDLIQNAMRGT